MPRPSLSVVLPARDAEALIGDQLAALAAQSTDDFEVVVADNGSADATASVANAHRRDLRLRVVDASRRPGVSHARNAGVVAAAADRIAFCDADDVVDHRWAEEMTAGLDAHDLVGGHLEIASLNPPEILRWATSPTADGLPVTMRFLPYAVGANLGVRRGTFEEVGGFDETYRGGHEEVAFAWRAQLAGHSIGFVPGAVVHYRIRADRRGLTRQRFGYGRSYARLYADFRTAGPPATPLKRELRTYVELVRRGPREFRVGRGDAWLASLAWTAGRLVGDVDQRVRCPL